MPPSSCLLQANSRLRVARGERSLTQAAGHNSLLLLEDSLLRLSRVSPKLHISLYSALRTPDGCPGCSTLEPSAVGISCRMDNDMRYDNTFAPAYDSVTR